MNSRSISKFFAAGLGLSLGWAAYATAYTSPEAAAEMDKPITSFTLKDVTHDAKEGEKPDAAMVHLAEYKGKKAVVLFFMSERCGTTWKYEKRVGTMLKDYAKKPVVFLGVRSSLNDTPETIRKYAESKHFDMPILDDPKSDLAYYFKARNTPAFVVVDKDGAYRYFGGFDDNADETAVTKTYLKDALDAVLAGKDVPVKKTSPLG